MVFIQAFYGVVAIGFVVCMILVDLAYRCIRRVE
jgi:hypothetical protein